MSGISNTENLLKGSDELSAKLNVRQLSLLNHALKKPKSLYTIQQHQNTHGIAPDTARRDLLYMSDSLHLLIKLKRGKSFIFMASDDLEEMIRDSK